MNSSFPHKFKEYIYTEFQKEIDKETEINDEIKTVDDLFYVFHETDMRERFNKLLVAGDIKPIYELLFEFLYVIKFFRTKKYNESDLKQSAKRLVSYIKEQKLIREKIYNN